VIDRTEIDDKAKEYGIHTSNVQRDYVFGWLLCAIYNNSYLAQRLILKGGNCFRKVYFPDTRFSDDLDFSTKNAIDSARTLLELNECCRWAQEHSGVGFDTEQTRFEQDRAVDNERTVWKGRVYFQDFYGSRSTMNISVRLDVTEFDRLHLDARTLPLQHPYSDAAACSAQVTCMALEELVALKMKCLLQRRYSYDLYDLVYTVFFEHPFEIDRVKVVNVFLRKTIFAGSPGSAKSILLGLPITLFRGAWEKYIVCPLRSRIDFDGATARFAQFMDELFALADGRTEPSLAFFPSAMRNTIMQAGFERRLMRARYHGIDRVVEPYSLAYKRLQNGVAREYLYVWDQTGGRSGPGVKSFLNHDIETLELLEERFEPRFDVELAKAGEPPARGYFGREFSAESQRTRSPARPPVSRARAVTRPAFGAPQSVYVIGCPTCGRQFERQSRTVQLKPHKNPHGWQCPTRLGFVVTQRYR
jgi:predicted nucleotidyltransferase component of viral defense system